MTGTGPEPGQQSRPRSLQPAAPEQRLHLGVPAPEVAEEIHRLDTPARAQLWTRCDYAPKMGSPEEDSIVELALRDAKTRLSELVHAAEAGERVVITRYGHPVVELVRWRRRGGLDFDQLEKVCRDHGLEEAPPDEAEAMMAAFHDPACSRRVLGLDQDGE